MIARRLTPQPGFALVSSSSFRELLPTPSSIVGLAHLPGVLLVPQGCCVSTTWVAYSNGSIFSVPEGVTNVQNQGTGRAGVPLQALGRSHSTPLPPHFRVAASNQPLVLLRLENLTLCNLCLCLHTAFFLLLIRF